MWLDIAVIAMVIVFIGFLTLWSLVAGFTFYKTRRFVEASIKKLVDLQVNGEKYVDNALKGITEVQGGIEQWKMVPKLLEGHIKLAQKNLVEYGRIHSAVERLAGLISQVNNSNPAKPEKSSLIEYDEGNAGREYDIQTLLQARPDIQREEAEQFVDTAIDYAAQHQVGVE